MGRTRRNPVPTRAWPNTPQSQGQVVAGEGPVWRHRFSRVLELEAENAIYDALSLKFSPCTILDAQDIIGGALFLRLRASWVVRCSSGLGDRVWRSDPEVHPMAGVAGYGAGAGYHRPGPVPSPG